MKRIIFKPALRLAALLMVLMMVPLHAAATGWPAHYGGVMLQGFYWNSYDYTKWTNLDSKVDEISKYFDLIWVPQSGRLPYDASGMGYLPFYWFDHNTTSFGSEEALKKMVSDFKAKGTTVIEDVVINHHNSLSQFDYFFFPAETYKSPLTGNETTYQLKSTDICANDDNGNSKTMLRGDQKMSTNNDEGDDFDGGRDLDHKSENVQNIVKAYENCLVNDIGYGGLRYDMVVGFNGSHIADYNKAAADSATAWNTAKQFTEKTGHSMRFSVGECWKSSSKLVKDWINSTILDKEGKPLTLSTDAKDNKEWDNAAMDGRIYSAAFDYPLKHGAINQAMGSANYSATGKKMDVFGLVGSNSPAQRRYAVTFVENHDTYYPRDDNTVDAGNMATANPLAANALILALPGTPCIYSLNWEDATMQDELKKMIMARKAAGVTNMSNIEERGYDVDDEGYYVVVQSDPFAINGDAVENSDGTKTGGNRILVCFGDVAKKSLGISEYTLVSEGTNYKFYIKGKNAVSRYKTYMSDSQTDNPFTKLDDPTKDNTMYAQDTVRTVSAADNVAEDKTIYVHMLKGTTAPYLWTWDYKVSDKWPGAEMKETEVISGVTYYKYTFSTKETVNCVISDGGTPRGSGSDGKQTKDIMGITGEKTYIVWDDTKSKDVKGDYQIIDENKLNTVSNPDTLFLNNTFTAFFKMPASWENERSDDKPYALVSNDNTYFSASYPGDVMSKVGTVDGKDLYRWSYLGAKEENVEPKYITFALGNYRTNALAFENGKVYDGTALTEGTNVQTIEATGAAVPEELKNLNSFNVYVKAPEYMGQPKLYVWRDVDPWPNYTAKWDDRPDMTWVKKDGDKNLWMWTYAGNYAETDNLKAIVTAGSYQTQNLNLDVTKNVFTIDEQIDNHPMQTVYFKKPTGWIGDPQITVTNGTDSICKGETMYKLGNINSEDVYQWFYPSETAIPTTAKVKFSFSGKTLDGKDVNDETAELTYEEGKLYTGSRRPNGLNKKTDDAATCYVVATSDEVTPWIWPIDKSWSDFWTGAKDKGDAWPGTPMEKTEKTVDGKPVWSFTCNNGNTNIPEYVQITFIPTSLSGKQSEWTDAQKGEWYKWSYNGNGKDWTTWPFVDNGFYDQDEPDNVAATTSTATFDDATCVYLVRPKGWDGALKAHMWGTTYNPKWPGDAMEKIGTYNGKELWRWHYTQTGALTEDGLMFVMDTGWPKTKTLSFANKNYYEFAKNLTGSEGVAGGSDIPATGFMIRVSQPHGWPTPYITMKKSDGSKTYADNVKLTSVGTFTLNDKYKDVYVWPYAGELEEPQVASTGAKAAKAPAASEFAITFKDGGLTTKEKTYYPYYDLSSFDLTTAEHGSYLDAISALANRVFKIRQNATVIAPFAVPQDNMSMLGAKVYEFAGVDTNNVLTFKRVMEMAAGKPYFIIATETGKIFNKLAMSTLTGITSTAQVIQQTVPVTGGLTYNFTGNLGGTDIEKHSQYSTADAPGYIYYGYNADRGHFTMIKPDAEDATKSQKATIQPTVCYFYTVAPTAAAATATTAKPDRYICLIDDDGSTTSIHEIEGEPVYTEQQQGSSAMYNLQGQRVNSSYRGIVIYKGKKVRR